MTTVLQCSWLGRFLRFSPRRWLRAATRRRLPTNSGQAQDVPWDPASLWPVLATSLFAVIVPTLFIAVTVTLGLLVPIENYAEGILPTLWQVQAGVLGLAVAVSIFAFQAFGGLRGARRRLVRLTGFPAALLTGLSLSFFIGTATFVRTTQWGGWIGMAAVGLTGAWICLLVFVFEHAPNIQDRSFAIALRIRVLRRAVHAAVREVVLNRASFELFRERVRNAGGDVNIWPGAADPALNVVSGESGTVIDIDTAAISRIVRAAAMSGNRITLGTWLGQRVAQYGVLAESERPLDDGQRQQLRRAVITCASNATTLDDDLRDLHDEAMEQVGRPGGADVIDRVLDTYTEVLHDYARAWLAYTAEVTTDTLPTFVEGATSPLDAIRESVHNLYMRSIETNDRPTAFNLVYFPVGLATRAVEWQAPGYFQVVSLYPQFYAIANRGAVDADTRRIFTERSWWHPVEALELMIPSLMRSLPADAEVLAQTLRTELHRSLLIVFRLCVRHGDIDNFREGVRRWRLANR